MSQIKYVSAPCGSGKTHAIINSIVEGRYDGNLLLVQPTVQLIDNTYNEIKHRSPSSHVERFHSEIITDKSVAGALVKHFRNPYPGNHVLITTNSTFFNLPFIANKRNYDLVLDESHVLVDPFDEKLPDHHHLITDHLTLEAQGPSYGILKPKNIKELTSLAENRKRDTVSKLFAKLAKLILSDHYISYVNLQQYNNLIKGKQEDGHLVVYSVMQPTIFTDFRSVTILGARLEETALFKYWSDLGVSFCRDLSLENRLRYTEHNNGNLVHLHYGFEDNWSKYVRDTKHPELHEKIIAASLGIIQGEPYVWNENNDVKKTSILGQIAKGTELPGKSHGLNDYQHIDHAIIIPALNNKSYFQKFFIEVLGISELDQKIEMTGHTIYQALSRTSIRDPDNNNIKHWVIADKATAEYIASVYPGSTINSFKLLMPSACARPGRPRLHENSYERKKASKEKKLMMIAGLDKDSFFVRDNDLQVASQGNKKSDVSSIELNRHFVVHFRGSIFIDRFHGKHDSLIIDTDEKFVRDLRNRSRVRYESKEHNTLISPAYFDPHKAADTERGIENIVFVKGVWIDVDGGDMSPRDFSEMFPHIRMVCFNTYSSTGDDLRYRVYIPTDMAMTNDAYKMIFNNIVRKVESEGYVSKSKATTKSTRRVHGIDNKPNGSDLFYLPCQPQDPGGAYFQDFKADRKPLKVKDWIINGFSEEEASYVSEPPSLSDSDDLTPDQESKVADALREWDAVGSKPGNGNAGIFNLGHRLRRTGISAWRLETILRQSAQTANSPLDRMKDVRRFMRQYATGMFS
ncbi:DEAD/DEAH box helicase [Methylobacterium sp. 174MFSha1.1]|uniref:DEAD/DEAH box helicase family protein n=1 Tax=Methylobacterium sp. 174MFSha1.1 TaxID=1502749 RepID=UPI0008E4BD4D|nr:DEAD/DEAH box helicase family protein [Methylobacterium sp. 174MFSha1.1]SFU42726.1 DEAD/DEAH box helicase [Methylobacterium sp. 174MFSha1.1]